MVEGEGREVREVVGRVEAGFAVPVAEGTHPLGVMKSNELYRSKLL